MKTIVANRGRVILVDDADFVFVSQYNWTTVKYKHTFYAIRNIFRGHKVIRHVFMHRELLGLHPGDGVKIDHEDGNGLNNQRYNLRHATGTQNNANRRKGTGTTSRFKGVYLDKRRRTWQAEIKIGRRKQYLGSFSDETQAALAYNAAAKQLFGDFAKLNHVA